jgi:transketolase N-terminal domain/subunit/transketolase C-terminal domain/subunit
MNLNRASSDQNSRNKDLLAGSRYLSKSVSSEVLPLHIEMASTDALTEDQINALNALEIEAARTSIRSLASLSGIGEADHLGGGLGLIPPLVLSLAVADYERIEYTIEHAHTSIGYFSALSAFGFLSPDSVVNSFRRGLDIPGHVSWLPGGTQLNGGRLGVMIPVAVGQALGKRGVYGDGSWVIVHCGDAGWISGQALNGFNGAHVHEAPVTFVMDRNGIQLSGSTKSILDKDPRTVISALGVEILEIPTVHDVAGLYSAYREAYNLAQSGKPSLIYPVGYESNQNQKIDLTNFGERYRILEEVKAFAAQQDVPMDKEVWIPGSLMSFRDIKPMLECVFLVNDLPGGAGHHDGGMKGRDADEVLSGPMFSLSDAQNSALNDLRSQPATTVVTDARPAPGSPNLVLPADALAACELPGAGDKSSARGGSEAGYALVAKTFPQQVFVVGCDLDPSTKLGKARSLIQDHHQFEMSIEEQAAALLTNGLATSTKNPQLNVVSTFAAFFEGIAREGFDMWQYQRNLTGVNEGLNVTFHLSHVGACTGRDHFSGWGLDWVNVGLTYLDYLHRFYAPADTRAAFLAVVDLAAHYGGHVIGIPRDDLPVLVKQDGSAPLWKTTDRWEAVTSYRTAPGAKKAVLALGAPAFLAGEAFDTLQEKNIPVDVHIVNGLPLSEGELEELLKPYSEGVVTIEDGKIGDANTGLRGFAGLVATGASALGNSSAHVGITDPRVAPSEGHMETWEHFGITSEAVVTAVESL